MIYTSVIYKEGGYLPGVPNAAKVPASNLAEVVVEDLAPLQPTICYIGTTDGITFPDPTSHLGDGCTIRAVNPVAAPGMPSEWQYVRTTSTWHTVSGLNSTAY